MKSTMRSFLVTGAHRTGTTWVGRMLAAAPRLAYISEPLNVFHRPGILGAPVPYWYTYICNENEFKYLPTFQQLVNFRYHLFSAATALRSAKDFLRMGRDLGIFLQAGLLHRLPLLKGPLCCLFNPLVRRKVEQQGRRHRPASGGFCRQP